jgi:surfactin synthase thioesterase subunit
MPVLLTLYCLPYAGASATIYLRWRRLIPAWIEIVPIELPGRGMRMNEDVRSNYPALTSFLSDEIARSAPQHYALFGHSMGALLAFGVTQQLRQMRAVPPVALLIAGCAAPSRQDSRRYSKIRTEADLIADLNQQGGTPEEVFKSPELLAMTLDLLRADYQVCESFQYTQQIPLPVPIHCFGGKTDVIDAENLDTWRLESSRLFTLDWFDGGHFFLRHSEEWFLQVLTRRLLESHGSSMMRGGFVMP